MVSRIRRAVALALGATLIAACGGAAGESQGTLRIYTSVTQDTVDAVVDGFEAANPAVTVAVFRAPTGELAARIAAEQRQGEVQAYLLWLTDPLSMQQYAADGLLRSWDPEGVDAVPSDYRTDTFFGTRVLNIVIVASRDLDPAPGGWRDLALVDGVVAIPDPAFAGSAFGTLAYFALDPDFGLEFFRDLKENGGVQVRAPGDVVTGVAEGLYAAGMTLDRTAQEAVDDGSPVVMVWPESGAIAIYSPIAVVGDTEAGAAEPFVEYILGLEAQTAIAETGWEPVRGDVEWPDRGSQQVVDWEEAFEVQDQLLSDYAKVFSS